MASTTFNYTGADQSWTVPAGVSSVTVDAYGAESGRSGNGGKTNQLSPGLGSATSGKGARVQTTIPVTPGEVLTVRVAGAGGNAIYDTSAYPWGRAGANGWNGGHSGRQSGSSSSEPFISTGGSGGVTEILRGGTLLVAAGGGGSPGAGAQTYNGSIYVEVAGGNGGNAGQTGTDGGTGATKTQDVNTAPGGDGGGGATQSAGGSAGAGLTNGTDGNAGGLKTGGFGGGGATDDYNRGLGGPGGGGYYGGGGGEAGAWNGCCGIYGGGGAGGGGSSYSVAAATFTSGARVGSGTLTLTYNSAPNTPTSLLPSGAQAKNTVTLSAVVSDPDGNNVYAQFQYSTDNATWTTINGSTVASGSTSSVSVTLAANTTYYLRARAVDSGGAVSGYTASQTFITNRLPSAPGAFTSPTAGLTVDTTGLVEAGAATDPDAQTLTYEWDLSLNGGSTWTNKRALSAGLSWTYTYTTEAETNNAQWRVRANDGINYGPYTTSALFNISHGSYVPAMIL